MAASCVGGRFDREARRWIAFSGVLGAALLFVAIAAPEAGAGNRSECNSNCGGSGQNACSVFDCVPSCDKFLRERLESCGFLCTESICRSSGCGSTNQRACIPFVDHGWPDICRAGNYNAGGVCKLLDSDGFPPVCGDEGERACTLAEHFPSCKFALVEVVSSAGSICRSFDPDGYPSHCGDAGEPPCETTERLPSCKSDHFEYDSLCNERDADDFPRFCGGLNESPCPIDLQVIAGVSSCKSSLEEDFVQGLCLDACGGNGLPACALDGCDAGFSLQVADAIDNFVVCGKQPIDWGETDAHESLPGGPRVVFFIHGRGNDLTTQTYDADEPLLNELAFNTPNIVAVYGVDWNNQAGNVVADRRRVEIRLLERQGGVPVWTFVGRYGRTPLYSNDFVISDISQAIAQAIDDLDITIPITLVTHSYGGVIARDLVYRHYDDLREGNHEIVEVLTIKGPHRGGLIGVPDLVAGFPIPASGLALQTDFACATGRAVGLLGFGTGHDGCLLGRWIDWSLAKAPFGIDDTSYPQIRWIAIAGGGHPIDAVSIDLVLEAEVGGVAVPLDPRFEDLLEHERDPESVPFLDSDETVPTRSAFGLAVDACYPFVPSPPPGSSATSATIVFDEQEWGGRESLSATCYHASATTTLPPAERVASDHDLSSVEAEREFAIESLPEPGWLPALAFGGGALSGIARRREARRRRAEG